MRTKKLSARKGSSWTGFVYESDIGLLTGYLKTGRKLELALTKPQADQFAKTPVRLRGLAIQQLSKALSCRWSSAA